eukprot:TRINITY_DN2232_c0_g1_i1.p1 TRINITY_DN2232_c0_g1~~TRINITY_DN2232_c0_g1_i1.p1  ORF type:complete len:185 (+),score=42.77 TRINITY_DN2232_c0_g1_i1:61-615(+)
MSREQADQDPQLPTYDELVPPEPQSKKKKKKQKESPSALLSATQEKRSSHKQSKSADLTTGDDTVHQFSTTSNLSSTMTLPPTFASSPVVLVQTTTITYLNQSSTVTYVNHPQPNGRSVSVGSIDHFGDAASHLRSSSNNFPSPQRSGIVQTTFGTSTTPGIQTLSPSRPPPPPKSSNSECVVC